MLCRLAAALPVLFAAVVQTPLDGLYAKFARAGLATVQATAPP